jgi:NTE family protein
MAEVEDATRINLIMAGGGVRFPAYVGALAAFEEMGVEILSVAGASAGSIVGSLLAAGWSVKDMHRRLMEMDFTEFKDFTLLGLLFEGGLYSGNAFERWMDVELKGATFRDLPRELFVTAVDLVGREPFFFSKHTTPDVPVSKAVRCSMAIPWVWRPQRWDRKLLVDGQLMPWVPTGIEMMERAHVGGPARTVMLRMASTDARYLPDKKYLWPWDFAKILLDTMLNALENQRIPGSLWQDTILIQVKGVTTLQLDLSAADRERLFQAGYEQAKRYFRKSPAAPGMP